MSSDRRPRSARAPGVDAGKPSTQHGRSGDDGYEVEPSTGQRLAQLAHELQRRNDPQAVMEHIVTAAVGLVPGVQDATITRVRSRRHVFSEAAAGPLGALLDELQDETGEGPCLDALYEDQTVRVADLPTDPRWPRLAQRADQAGLRSLLCFQLFVEGDNLGSLDLISSTPDVFDDEAEDVGQLFAVHAAIALAGVEKLSNVRVAMDNRDVIGQAKGILMERYKLSADQAFALLAKTSQDTNNKLRDVAEELALTGQLNRGGRDVGAFSARADRLR